MYSAHDYVIRFATEDDADAVRRLSELDSRRPIGGRILIAEQAGVAIAALSLDEGRSVADPFRHTAGALIRLRMRANALTAYERTPSVRDRIAAATRMARRRPAAERA